MLDRFFDVIINNIPEIIVIIIVAPLKVFLIEQLKEWFPEIKKHKRSIFLSTFFSSNMIAVSVAIAGWIPFKSIPIVFLAIMFLSQAIYDQIVKRWRK